MDCGRYKIPERIWKRYSIKNISAKYLVSVRCIEKRESLSNWKRKMGSLTLRKFRPNWGKYPDTLELYSMYTVLW